VISDGVIIILGFLECGGPMLPALTAASWGELGHGWCAGRGIINWG